MYTFILLAFQSWKPELTMSFSNGGGYGGMGECNCAR